MNKQLAWLDRTLPLATQRGFGFGSFNDNLHVFYKPAAPSWARHIVKPI